MTRNSLVAVPLAVLAVAALASCGDPVLPTSPSVAPPTQPRLDVAPGARTGTWSPVFNWPHVAAHMIGLPDGKVITWTSGDMDHSHKTENVHVWDPANPGSFKQVSNNTADVFCAGHSFLPNGDLMVAGGHLTVDMGINEAYMFNSGAARWSKTALNMARGRWYPSTVTLGNGDVLVIAGNDENHLPNPLGEVWEASTQRWRLLEGAPLVLPYYPRLHLAPDGRAFVAGPEAQTRWLNPTGSGAWTDGPVIPGGFRSEGTAVMYQPGKLLVFGGNDPATATAYTLDLNVAGAAWQPTGSLRYARRHFSVQMLPDGRVLAMGGTAAGNEEGRRVLASEVWDPATGVWTEWAPVAVTRTYHSSAVLLQDGRLLNAGGGRCGEGCPDYANAQIFTPPYLLNADGTAATRPTITGAPTSVSYGQSFTVQTPDAAGIARVSWVRLPAFTHAIDMNQRFVPLTFSKPPATTAGQLTVTAPTNPNLAPPGHYMMFVLNAAGVPSVARVVRIDGSAPLPALPAPGAPGTLAATAPTNTSASLTWSDNSNSETGFRVERCQGAGCTSFAEVATVAAGLASYANTGLTAGTSYSYRVRAVNSTGFSPYSNVATVTTPTTRDAIPVVDRASGKCLDVLGGGVQPNGQDVWLWSCYAGAVNQSWLVPAAGTAGEVRVYADKCLDAWTAAGNSGDPIKIYTCTGGANQQWTYTAAGELKGINGWCVNLAPGGAATDGSGYLVLGACTDGGSRRWNVPASPAPTDRAPIAAFTPACSNLTCTFDSNASSDDHGITGRRWSFGDGASEDDGSVGGTPVVRTKSYATAGTYTVTLTVTDAAGQNATATQSVTATAPPVPAPTAPSALNATLRTSSRVDLQWTDNSTNETGFHVERCVGSGCTTFAEYAAVGTDVTTYANTELAAGTTYRYRVHAVNGSASSANSNEVTVTTPTANQPPTAAFTHACSGLTCSFTDASTDADGTVAAWHWGFGDGATSTARSPDRTYAAAGTYTVTLTATDDRGATTSASKSVTVSAPAAIDLSARGYKDKGFQYVQLTWSRAAATSVDLFRDGTKLLTTANDGTQLDELRRKGSGSYRYQVCDANTTRCSDEVTVTF
jgi:PKD repeat protein